jgi:prepilin-type N-terminal cleavage/methylation domain-containing protein
LNGQNNRGYTLIEMLVTLGLVAILSAISAPPVMQWLANQSYKDQARELLQTMQLGRSTAISKNLELQVDVDIANKKYRLLRGKRSAGTDFANTTSPEDHYDVIIDWKAFSASVLVKYGDMTTCNGSDNVYFTFKPNGSAALESPRSTDLQEPVYICFFDPKNMAKEKYKVGVAMATSGRPTIE